MEDFFLFNEHINKMHNLDKEFFSKHTEEIMAHIRSLPFFERFIFRSYGLAMPILLENNTSIFCVSLNL